MIDNTFDISIKKQNNKIKSFESFENKIYENVYKKI